MRHDATRAERRLENAAQALSESVHVYVERTASPHGVWVAFDWMRAKLAEYDDAFAHRHDRDTDPGRD